ncbi:MAG TPA: hypothetical protein PK325_04310 [Cyclobacteriaceae bacterium]|nr:hypothetical protein [Cyclobacteriaceae bacterium]HMV10496.1 hypothetical protein [Cyclobacteriaceae bacterium]HMV89939.1 hypothetical protein [Cyclobacteriaceae bacterium]HMX01789.1 hypothetical protein [Cyclobacteriaceae bacterium]HMX51536.1 hypothetical protein [Cyclobacteriaceae bacterium]
MKQLIFYLGVLISVSILVGFVCFFSLNPSVFKEINNLPVGVYNVDQIELSIIPKCIYLITGFLTIIYASLALVQYRHILLKLGALAILVTGLIWMSFGLISVDPNSESDYGSVILRSYLIVLFILTAKIILLVHVYNIGRGLIYKTLTAILIGIDFLFLFITMFSPSISWTFINIILLIYFFWLAFEGYFLSKPLTGT